MIRRVFLAVLIFGVTACGDDGTGDDGTSDDGTRPESVVGTYTLQTVGGEGLPVVLEENPTFLLELTAGIVTLNQDLSCTNSLTSRETRDGTVTTGTNTDVCTYTLNNGAITLTISANNTISGSISGSTLTLTSNFGVFVYEK